MKIRPCFSIPILLFLVLCFSLETPAQNSQTVTLYEDPNFGGRSKSLSVDADQPLNDFNDVASSIKVPDGLVAIVYKDAGPVGGFGLFVDFLEDQADLAKYNLDNEISYIKIFKKKSREGYTWVRNSTETVKPGYWHMGRSTPPAYPHPVVGNRQQIPCTISGTVKNNKPQYQTQITLYINGSPTQFSTRVRFERYTIQNVPEGVYEVRGKLNNNTATTASGMPTGFDINVVGRKLTTCRDGASNPIDFVIRSRE